METREQYLSRIGVARPHAALGKRIRIGGASVVDTIDVEIHEHLTAMSRVAVLVKDLGTLSPYKELGRGGRSAQ